MNLIFFALIIGAAIYFFRKPGVARSIDKVETTVVSGTVVGASKYAKTSVSGSGRANGPVSVSSTVTVHQQFFIRRSDGVEKPVKAWGLDVPIADGQRVSVLYSSAGEKAIPGYLINHTADQSWPLFTKAGDVAVRLGVAPGTGMMFVRALVAAVVTAFLVVTLSGIVGVSAEWAVFLGYMVFLPAAVVMLIRDRLQRRAAGAALMAAYRAHERDLAAAPMAAAAT